MPSPLESRQPITDAQDIDPAWQYQQGTILLSPDAVLVNFDGATALDNAGGLAPPDPNGDVGPDHYVQMVNVITAIYDKTGSLLLGPVDNNIFWSGFGGPCDTLNSGDPIVLYDPLADRWIITQFAVTNPGLTPNSLCVACSQTPDPTGSYYRYEFPFGTTLPDYPKYGVWPDAYLLTTRNFSPFEMMAGALERDSILTGGPAQMVLFSVSDALANFDGSIIDGVLPVDLDGSTPPSAGTPGFFIGHQDNAATGAAVDRLALFDLTLDWANTANSVFGGPFFLPTNPFDSDLCAAFRESCIPQPSTATGLEVIPWATMHRAAVRNMGSYLAMVANHTVDVNDFSGHAGIRWYELQNSGGGGSGWSINQQGTYAPDPDHRWMGSIAMDAVGNISLAYSVSSDITFPSIRYTGRLAGNPPGQMTLLEQSIFEGSASQTTVSRWGDYSMLAVDPSAEGSGSSSGTFWYTNEYLGFPGGFTNWRTRIAAFTLEALPGPNISVTPPSVDFGQVPVSTTVPTQVTIGNIGDADLTVSSISSPGGDFSLSNLPSLPVVISPQGTETFDVSFSPLTSGVQTSSFNINSDAVNDAIVTVNLQGEGIIANDLCSYAIPIDCGSTIDGTTVLATFDNVGTCGTSNTAPGVWYSLVGTGAPITVSTCLGASYDTKLSVFSGSCGALVCVGGNDDFSGCGLRSQVTFNSVAGTTYYVLVHGFLSATGTFTLSTSTCPAEIAVDPAALTFTLDLNGSASQPLTISNTANPPALDLQWTAISLDGAAGPGQGGQQPGLVPQPIALFQITEETINTLHSMHLPTAIWRGLEIPTSQPPTDKENFVTMVSSTIGEENTQTFYLEIMENSIHFYDEIKELSENENVEPVSAQESVPGNITPPVIEGAGGPDAFGYEWIDSDEPGGPVFTWTDITGTGTSVTLGDDASILVPLPFSFPFYGVNQSQVRIGSNGYLTFGTSGSTFTNTNIPNSATPNHIICPFWDDLNPTTGGTIHYLPSPTQFIVQYTQIRRFATTQPNTFQVILNADGSMLFQYLDMQGLLTSSTVGIENATGTVGLQVVFNAAYIHNNLAVRLSLPAPCAWISSLTPDAGTIPPGGSQPVTLDVDAAGLPAGIYYCELVINSNAANENRVVVPVTLNVIHPFIFLADDQVLIDEQDPTARGNVHSNNDILIGRAPGGTTHTGNLTAVDNIEIRDNNIIDGNVTAGGIAMVDPSATVNGTVTSGASVPIIPLPTLSFGAGGPDLFIPPDGSASLAPGSYNIVDVGRRGTLTLETGEYFMNELVPHTDAVIRIDVGGGPVTVNVVDLLQFRRRSQVEIFTNGLNPDPSSESETHLVTFNYSGTTIVPMVAGSRVLGTIVAPNAKVRLRPGVYFKGAICADNIRVDDDVIYQPHDILTPEALTAPTSLAMSGENLKATLPTVYELSQNYPNPFNPSTVIEYALPEESAVRLEVYNVLGQRVATLVDETQSAGYYAARFDATELASGLYIYRMQARQSSASVGGQAGNFVETRKLMLLK